MTAPAPEWLDQALCAGAPDHIFFPIHGAPADTARRYCAACPVRIDCLRFALDVEDGCGPRVRHGVWGGMTPTERIRLSQRKRRTA